MDRNRTVVDVVILPRQSNEARQRDMKAPCGCDSRKPVQPVGTGIINVTIVVVSMLLYIIYQVKHARNGQS